jgi:hypothetical protein
MSTKHTVTLPDGSTATRTSTSRVYPFAVAVGPAPKAEVLARLTADVKLHEEYVASYVEVVDYLKAGGELEAEVSAYGATSIYAKDLKPRGSRSHYETQRGQRCIGHGNDTAETIATQFEVYIANAEASIEAHKAELIKVAKGPELVGKWRVSGWSSRPELASKERDRLAGRYVGREVIVVETTYVTK